MASFATTYFAQFLHTLCASIDSFWGLPDRGKFTMKLVIRNFQMMCVVKPSNPSCFNDRNSMGVLHRAVPNHKFNQIFLKEWRIATNYCPEYSPHRTNFCLKFRVALTPSRNMSLKVQAIQNYTCLENSQKCCRSFVLVKNSSKS